MIDLSPILLETTAPVDPNGAGSWMYYLVTFGPLVLIVVLMYFIMIRPQRKKQKEEQKMRNSLRVGDEITTIGGVVGRVVKIEDNTIIIETSEDRVRMEFAKWAVSTVGVQKSIEDTNNNKKNRKKQTPEERAESFSLEDTASEEANKE